MPRPPDTWSIEGLFQHLIYSPKGAIEGMLITTEGVPTQFVTDPKDAAVADQLRALEPGQAVVVEGSEEGPSPKGEAPHFVYRLARLASVDGYEAESPSEEVEAKGKVTRFNYAKHGAPNGVVLDSGDFVHTKPAGLERLGLSIGDRVRATGPARPLVTGTGRVIEARTVNGRPVDPDY